MTVYCDELWDVEWKTAHRWTGRVYLDEVEITEDCLAVGYRGDVAAYVILYLRNDAGAFFADVSEDAAKVVRAGAIRAELTPLPEVAAPCALAWNVDADYGAAPIASVDNATSELVDLAREGDVKAFHGLAACLMPVARVDGCWRGTRRRLGMQE